MLFGRCAKRSLRYSPVLIAFGIWGILHYNNNNVNKILKNTNKLKSPIHKLCIYCSYLGH